MPLSRLNVGSAQSLGHPPILRKPLQSAPMPVPEIDWNCLLMDESMLPESVTTGLRLSFDG